jgi:hypothetical protein
MESADTSWITTAILLASMIIFIVVKVVRNSRKNAANNKTQTVTPQPQPEPEPKNPEEETIASVKLYSPTGSIIREGKLPWNNLSYGSEDREVYGESDSIPYLGFVVGKSCAMVIEEMPRADKGNVTEPDPEDTETKYFRLRLMTADGVQIGEWKLDNNETDTESADGFTKVTLMNGIGLIIFFGESHYLIEEPFAE